MTDEDRTHGWVVRLSAPDGRNIGEWVGAARNGADALRLAYLDQRLALPDEDPGEWPEPMNTRLREAVPDIGTPRRSRRR